MNDKEDGPLIDRDLSIVFIVTFIVVSGILLILDASR